MTNQYLKISWLLRNRRAISKKYFKYFDDWDVFAVEFEVNAIDATRMPTVIMDRIIEQHTHKTIRYFDLEKLYGI